MLYYIWKLCVHAQLLSVNVVSCSEWVSSFLFVSLTGTTYNPISEELDNIGFQFDLSRCSNPRGRFQHDAGVPDPMAYTCYSPIFTSGPWHRDASV
jgi:hypothetical protein